MSLTPYLHVDASLADASDGEHLDLDAATRRHLHTVLRLRPGAPCHVADGRGGHGPAVLTGTGVRLTAHPVLVSSPSPRLVVAQALAKGRKFDDVVRAVTELGADAVVPVVAARSVTRVDDKADKAVERWRAVARAAAEQSRRPWRADVTAPVHPATLWTRPEAAVLVAHPGAAPLHTVSLSGAVEVVLAIGPEGGWDEREMAAATAAGAVPVGLGPTVLRTEHAAAAGLAVLAASVGRWDPPHAG